MKTQPSPAVPPLLLNDFNGIGLRQCRSLTFYHQKVLAIQQAVFSGNYFYERIILAKQFIDKFYFENLDIGIVARKAYFSKFHFIRLFKESYGVTPHQYLITVRVAAAKKLLLSGLPLTHVCASVGFNSTTSFTALFKKMTGSAPSALQKKQF